jgi:hypothetical protein
VTAFCVFASSMPVARERAEKKVPLVDKDSKPPRRYTEAEWRALVDERASDVFASMSPVQVSPAFDAPQFCEEWISIARTTGEYEGYVIKCRGTSLDAKGNPKISKSTGMPIITWVLYEPRKAA